MSLADVSRVIPREDLFKPSPLQSSWSIEELEEELQEWYSSFELYDDFPSDYIFESDASTSDSNHSDHSDSDKDLVVDIEREELWKRTHQHLHKNSPSLRDHPSKQHESVFHNILSHTTARKSRFAALANIFDAHIEEALDSFASSRLLSSEPRLIAHYSRLPSSPTKHQPLSPSPLRRELRLFKRRSIINPSNSNVLSSGPKLVAHYSPLSITPVRYQATSPSPLRQELYLFDPLAVIEKDSIDPVEKGCKVSFLEHFLEKESTRNG